MSILSLFQVRDLHAKVYRFVNNVGNAVAIMSDVYVQDNGNVAPAASILIPQSPAVTSDSELIPLDELVDTFRSITCGAGFVAVRDTRLDRQVTHAGRKIPRIIHMTSKHRCVHPLIAECIDDWRLQGYSFYFHDEEAVDRLLAQDYTQVFPDLREIRKCVTVGATKADLWRLVVLWTYGGVYSDINNTPTSMLNETTIRANDDAMFLRDTGTGTMSQYFMAASKFHPLLKYVMNPGIQSLKGTVNVMLNNPAQTTGPNALKRGYIQFMKESGVQVNGYVRQGVYTGAENRSIRVLGTPELPKEFLNRDIIGVKRKKQLYMEMNMTHFRQIKTLPRIGRISCREHLSRTNGTDMVANYKFDPTRRMYAEVVNTT